MLRVPRVRMRGGIVYVRVRIGGWLGFSSRVRGRFGGVAFAMYTGGFTRGSGTIELRRYTRLNLRPGFWCAHQKEPFDYYAINFLANFWSAPSPLASTVIG